MTGADDVGDEPAEFAGDGMFEQQGRSELESERFLRRSSL